MRRYRIAIEVEDFDSNPVLEMRAYAHVSEINRIVSLVLALREIGDEETRDIERPPVGTKYETFHEHKPCDHCNGDIQAGAAAVVVHPFVFCSRRCSELGVAT